MAKLMESVRADDHVQGSPEAKITLLEYGDFQCPHCAMAHAIVKRVQNKFGDKLRFVFRNFPLIEIHPWAEPAAEAAEFADAYGTYWEMHNAIFEHQRRLSLPMLVSGAEKLGLDPKAAETAISRGAYRKRIEDDMQGAERMGVHATPTFFINGQQYGGAWHYEELVEAIEAVK